MSDTFNFFSNGVVSRAVNSLSTDTSALMTRGTANRINLTGSGDLAGIEAEIIKPLDGFFDVIAHGSPDSIQVVGATGKIHTDVAANVLARYLNMYSNYSGGPVRLLSCETGMFESGFAGQLRYELGADVLAPNNILWAPSGNVTGMSPFGDPILPPTGYFELFPKP